MEFARAAPLRNSFSSRGKEHCGAVKGAIDGVLRANLTAPLHVIATAADEVL